MPLPRLPGLHCSVGLATHTHSSTGRHGHPTTAARVIVATCNSDHVILRETSQWLFCVLGTKKQVLSMSLVSPPSHTFSSATCCYSLVPSTLPLSLSLLSCPICPFLRRGSHLDLLCSAITCSSCRTQTPKSHQGSLICPHKVRTPPSLLPHHCSPVECLSLMFLHLLPA